MSVKTILSILIFSIMANSCTSDNEANPVTKMKIPKNTPSEWTAIECLNWPDDYPYAPEVKFRVWHDGEFFHIEYRVKEETTKAEQTVPGGPVYEDSCVECFIQPFPETAPHYYNFEWNAAGHLAMACRTVHYLTWAPIDTPARTITARNSSEMSSSGDRISIKFH